MALEKIPYDSRASTEDMANALRNASSGNKADQLKDLQRYNTNTQAPVQRGQMEKMLEEGYGTITTPSYASPLGSLEDYMSGFREFEQNNPYSGVGTAAMMPATLPGGFRYDFTGSQQANKFNDYLESIGQAPYERYSDESMIKRFANGGGIGTMMQPKKKSYKDQSLTKAQQKKTKPANQGGGPNYLGKQEEVTTPKRWLSSPDHVVAELAYITPREQKILLDANIYGSLKGKPNKGPNGIMSLQGDLGGFSSGGGNKGGSGGSGGSSGGGGNDYKARDYYNMMTGTGTTAKSATGDTYRSNKIAKGAVPEFVNTPSGTKYVGSKFKSYGQPTFFGDLFSGGASGYRGTKGTGTGPFGTSLFAGSPIGLRGTRLKNGQILGGEYFSENEDVGDLKQSIGERISNFGITGIVKNLFKKEPKDMTEFNNLGLGGINPATLDFDPNAKIQNTPFTQETGLITPKKKPNIIGIENDPMFTNAMAKLSTKGLIEYNKLNNKKLQNQATDGLTPELTPEETEKLKELEIQKNEAAFNTTAIV